MENNKHGIYSLTHTHMVYTHTDIYSFVYSFIHSFKNKVKGLTSVGLLGDLYDQSLPLCHLDQKILFSPPHSSLEAGLVKM